MAIENGRVNPTFVGDGLQQEKVNSVNEKNGFTPNDDGNFHVTATAEENRATWGNSIEFLFSCIAMNVGLGNIWRFPFVAYENGGGAFLIPYILVLIFIGRPMYYLEMCLGQFCNRGNVKMFERLAPILKGVGYGQLIATWCVATYYCSLMAISLFYLVNSFTNNLPWSQCDPSWQNGTWLTNNNMVCVPSQSTEAPSDNSVSSAELWFRIEVLKEASDISDGLGAPEWRLTLCLLVSWIITFTLCAKGVQSSGKASYFLAIFPYVILAALLYRALTLDGSGTGILYLFEPKWEMLLSAKVWYSAVSQCFFSLNIGFGSVTMYASYNNFKHNAYRDAMVVTTLDTGTSVLAGLIIFGILGNLAHKMGVEVGDVIKSGGTGLAFISYPEAIARFNAVPWLFAILFFSMLFILGIGSLIALKGCVITVIMDSFPHLKIWQVSLSTALLGFAIGLVYVTPGGQWIFTMVDFFGGTFIFYVLTIVEIVSVAWWYGLEEICLDLEFMVGSKPGAYWRICWGLIIPVVLLVVFGYFLITLEPLTYEKKEYPSNILVWGWVLLAFGISQPFVWFVIELTKINKKVDCNEALLSTLSHDKWGPQDPKTNRLWQEFKQEAKSSRIDKRSWIAHKLCILIGK